MAKMFGRIGKQKREHPLTKQPMEDILLPDMPDQMTEMLRDYMEILTIGWLN